MNAGCPYDLLPSLMIFFFCQENKGSLASSCILTLPCDKSAVGHEDGGQSVVFTTWMTKTPTAGDTGGKTSGGTSVSIRVGSLSIDVWLPQQPGVRPPPLEKSWVHQSSTHRAQLVHNAPLPSDRNTCFVYLSVHDGEFPAILWVQQHTEPQPSERRP